MKGFVMDGRSLKGKTIIIDNGETFEGSIDQFKNCFFSNVNLKTIELFCKQMNSTFEIKDEDGNVLVSNISIPNELGLTNDKIASLVAKFCVHAPDARTKEMLATKWLIEYLVLRSNDDSYELSIMKDRILKAIKNRNNAE